MKLTDKQFIQKWNDIKSPTRMAEDLGLTCRSIYKRRAALERKYGINLDCPAPNSPKRGRAAMTPGNMRREMDIDNFQVTMTFTLMTTLEAMQDWNASGLDDNDLIEIAKYDIERVIKSCVDYTKL